MHKTLDRVEQTALDAMVMRRFLTGIFLSAAALSLALGVCMYAAWVTSGARGVLTVPYENFLLYDQHYDWVEAPFLQAFRATTILAVCLGLVQLLPRAARNPKTWFAGAVLSVSVQVAAFNIVVDYMAHAGWAFNIYLAMSWLEPWLMYTLGTVSEGLFSTGGLAFIGLGVSFLAIFVIRRGRGRWLALTDSLLFASVILLVFEIGIAEYMYFWWDRQVTDFQYLLGLDWLTNQMVFSGALVSTIVLVCLRVASWKAAGPRSMDEPVESRAS